MEFEIDRDKINRFKQQSNYRKSKIYNIGIYMWSRWHREKTSPCMSSLEQMAQYGDLNAAELAIAILETREEYRQKHKIDHELEFNVWAKKVFDLLKTGTQSFSAIISELNINSSLVVSSISVLQEQGLIKVQTNQQNNELFYSIKD
jgi:DNA-binding MarR family transcriptional regulator